MDTTAANGATGTATSPETATLASAQAKLARIEQELNLEVLEREKAIRAVLCAMLAGEHLVFLGPPGSAKTDLVRRASRRFTDPGGNGLRFFYALLTRFSKVEELYGPVRISRLKQDEYSYNTTRKLPEAQLVFLDEPFKSSSAILNTMLTLMNERLFDNGNGMEPVPLISLFGASNEMPQGNDLGALWDRYIFRIYVEYLSDPGYRNLLQMVIAGARAKGAVLPMTAISQTELALLQEYTELLPFSPSAVTALGDLHRDLKKDKGIINSDRRGVDCIAALRAHAVLEAVCKGRLDPLREGLDRIGTVFAQRPCQALSDHFTHSLLYQVAI